MLGKKKKEKARTNGHRSAADILKGVGMTRTDMYCHDCSKNFAATLDYDLDGNHVVECPWCGHEHCRVITKGVVTDERWDSRNGDTHRVAKKHVVRVNGQPVVTSTASAFIRAKWLDHGSS